jgi:hypothetical protein
MVILIGSEPHTHNIKDFKMAGSPTKSGMVTKFIGDRNHEGHAYQFR